MNDALLKTAHQLVTALVPASIDGADVCRVCRSWKDEGDALCNNCLQVQAELPYPCKTVLPISLYRKPSALRDWLTYYKPNEERCEPEYGRNLRAILYAAWVHAGDALWCLTGGWNTIVVVPSTSRTRTGPHPLESELRLLDCFQYSQLLRRGRGVLGHRKMSTSGYDVIGDVQKMRVLLLDDVYTTGARSQSAASALTAAGANVCGILVIGRRINPDFADGAAQLWDRRQRAPFRFEDLFATV